MSLPSKGSDALSPAGNPSQNAKKEEKQLVQEQEQQHLRSYQQLEGEYEQLKGKFSKLQSLVAEFVASNQHKGN